MSAFDIFSPTKLPHLSYDLSCYEDDSIQAFLSHYGVDGAAEILLGGETIEEAMVTEDIYIE